MHQPLIKLTQRMLLTFLLQIPSLPELPGGTLVSLEWRRPPWTLSMPIGQGLDVNDPGPIPVS